MPGPKEDAYDEHISPLMTQVIALCKEHGINAFATFSLDPHPDCEDDVLLCTTYVPVDTEDGRGRSIIEGCLAVVRTGASFSAFTLTTRAATEASECEGSDE